MKFIRRAEAPLREEQIVYTQEAYGLSRVCARLLLSRGIEDIPAFLHPGEAQLNDPFCFPAMRAVCERLRLAAARGENTVVYSDYDADGTCGAAILLFALKELGIHAGHYIPNRFTEGYGTNAAAIEKIAKSGCRLLVTVDCGIRSVADVALAKSLGMECVILDHHEVSELPDTPFIVNPKLSYPNEDLCGAGVAFQTARALLGKRAMDWIDLAAVATIADIVSLRGENRAIVTLGLEKLAKDPNPGVAALFRAAGLSQIDAQSIAFGIAPRINAAGRIESGELALRLFLSKEEGERESIANRLQELNAQRQTLQKKVAVAATAQAEETSLADQRFLVVSAPGWEKGVVGLAAAKLAERYHRPCLVLSEEGGLCTGSARSIDGVNVYELLCQAEPLFLRFGGHAQAAGVTFKRERLEEVKRVLNEETRKRVPVAVFERLCVYDEELTPAEANLELAQELSRIEPYGEGNPPPVFLIQGEIKNAARVGSGEHYRFLIADQKAELPSIRFASETPVEACEKVCAAGAVEENSFRGASSVQFRVKAMMQQTHEAGNESEFIRLFPDEVVGLKSFLQGGPRPAVLGKTDFLRSIGEAFDQSPIAAVVVAATSFGAALLETETFRDVRYPPVLLPRGLSSAQTENAIAFSSAGASLLRHYERVYLAGAMSAYCNRPDAAVWFDEELLAAYRKEAGQYFAQKDVCREILSEIADVAKGERFTGISELLDVLKRPRKQAWFAFRVLYESKLIQIRKGDKIQFICKGSDSAFIEGEVFHSFAALLKGGARFV